MSKWKCGICNSEFDNYQAQGFNGIIYCPLCYFKELYKREKQEIERLTNNWNELEEWVKQNSWYYNTSDGCQWVDQFKLLDKIKEIKEKNNEK